jgi:hypothetical protein
MGLRAGKYRMNIMNRNIKRNSGGLGFLYLTPEKTVS